MTTPLDQVQAAIDEARYEDAEALLRPLINTGNAEADYLYGTLLFMGPEIVELDDALDAFERAAALDHPGACYLLATTVIDDADGVVTGAVADPELLMRAAELGDLDAQRTVAALHVTGEEGFPEDPAIARQWYQRAADQGDAESLYELGRMLLDGEGGPADPAAALELLAECAEQDYPVSERAADLLASITEEGRADVERDPQTAERWRERQKALLALFEQQKKEAADLSELVREQEEKASAGGD
jgi:uncharacterized protein